VVQEKRKLIDGLPNDGIAVLNGDDPYLADIADHASVRVIRFGRTPRADVRATDVAACYPDRLSFTVTCHGEEARVRTRLLGEHQLVPVLAALAAGRALGVPLAAAVRAIEACEPPRGRMEPIELADGLTFINDSYKAPYWSLEAVFEFMRRARAERKWIVFGPISDHPMNPRRLYRHVAKGALASCDRAVLIGKFAHHVPDTGGRIRAFAHVHEADAFLREALAPGDLVLVKGNNVETHLARLFLSRAQAVTCWREDCGLAIDCRSCRRLAR
jgi:UDP-N-acetylmuramoyl-tripeptide--D-alanyl-D-alanine ligase